MGATEHLLMRAEGGNVWASGVIPGGNKEMSQVEKVAGNCSVPQRMYRGRRERAQMQRQEKAQSLRRLGLQKGQR